MKSFSLLTHTLIDLMNYRYFLTRFNDAILLVFMHFFHFHPRTDNMNMMT